MHRVQKLIVVITLVFEAWLFHRSFVIWRSGEWHRAILKQYADSSPNLSGLIVSLGPVGLYARDHATVALDSIMGIGAPVFFVAIALFVWTLHTPKCCVQESCHMETR